MNQVWNFTIVTSRASVTYCLQFGLGVFCPIGLGSKGLERLRSAELARQSLSRTWTLQTRKVQAKTSLVLLVLLFQNKRMRKDSLSFFILFPIDEKVSKNQAPKKLLVSRNNLRISNNAFGAARIERGFSMIIKRET